MISSHNWFIIAGSLFALSGTAVLGRAFTSFLDSSGSSPHALYRRNEARVASWFGLPLLGLGFFSQALGQMSSSALTPLGTCFMLALVLSLILYLMLEGSIADHLSRPAKTYVEAPLIALPPPHRFETIEAPVPDELRLVKAAAAG